MGKVDEQQLRQQHEIQEGGSGSPSGHFCQRFNMGLIRIGRAFNFKCLFILMLSVCVFLSAVFWLPIFPSKGYRFDANDLNGMFLTLVFFKDFYVVLFIRLGFWSVLYEGYVLFHLVSRYLGWVSSIPTLYYGFWEVMWFFMIFFFNSAVEKYWGVYGFDFRDRVQCFAIRNSSLFTAWFCNTALEKHSLFIWLILGT